MRIESANHDKRGESQKMELTTVQNERLAVDVRQMAKMFPFAVRTLRRKDSAGKLPKGFKVGGRKLWRVSDLLLWTEWGFPDRAEFESRLKNLK